MATGTYSGSGVGFGAGLDVGLDVGFGEAMSACLGSDLGECLGEGPVLEARLGASSADDLGAGSPPGLAASKSLSGPPPPSRRSGLGCSLGLVPVTRLAANPTGLGLFPVTGLGAGEGADVSTSSAGGVGADWGVGSGEEGSGFSTSFAVALGAVRGVRSGSSLGASPDPSPEAGRAPAPAVALCLGAGQEEGLGAGLSEGLGASQGLGLGAGREESPMGHLGTGQAGGWAASPHVGLSEDFSTGSTNLQLISTCGPPPNPDRPTSDPPRSNASGRLRSRSPGSMLRKAMHRKVQLLEGDPALPSLPTHKWSKKKIKAKGLRCGVDLHGDAAKEFIEFLRRKA